MKYTPLVTLAIGAAIFSPQLSQTKSRTAKTASTEQTSNARSVKVEQIDVAGLKRLLAPEDGAKAPLLVNFWATWCAPCREEFPDLVKINHEYQTRGLRLITVSLDDPSEIRDAVPQFLEQMRATSIPAYILNAPEPDAAITSIDPAWGGALPTTFLFDQRRNIIFKRMGRIRPAELRLAIEKTLRIK